MLSPLSVLVTLRALPVVFIGDPWQLSYFHSLQLDSLGEWSFSGIDTQSWERTYFRLLWFLGLCVSYPEARFRSMHIYLS